MARGICCVRLTDLPRTTSFRLSLLFLLLFGTAYLLLFWFLYRETNGYLMNMADNWLDREQAVFAQTDERATLDRLRAHVMVDLASERPFVLFDPSGRRVAGNSLNVPPDLLLSAPPDRAFNFAAAQDGHELRYRGVICRIPSGHLLLIAQNTADAAHFDEVLVHACCSAAQSLDFSG